MTVEITQSMTGTAVFIEGFKGSEEYFPPYVFVGVEDKDTGGWAAQLSLTPENAHILSEQIRKHAEFAATPRAEEEK